MWFIGVLRRALTFDTVVAVNDAETSKESHVNRHLMLCDCVHRARDEGSVELDPFGYIGREGDVTCVKVDAPREDDIVAVGVPVAV